MQIFIAIGVIYAVLTSNRICHYEEVLMSLPDGFQWDPQKNKLLFYGVDSVLLWKDPSLSHMQNPVIEQLGESFYFLLVAYEASEGSIDNFNYIISRKNTSFEEGFEIFAGVVKTLGWGSMSLVQIDWKLKQATIEMIDPWELSIRETKSIGDNMPMICGKASGIFTSAMDCNMRAIVTDIQERAGQKVVTIEISESDSTLKSELEMLNKREGHTPYERVQILNKKLQETQLELEEANRKLTEQAIKDDLTGAYNRRYFMSQASKHHNFQSRYETPVSVLMLDIDNFKHVNDSYGHQAGDSALIAFADACKVNLRNTDLFCRLGGEEFTISMPGLGLESAIIAAEKIRYLIEQLKIEHNNTSISLTVSIGVVELQPQESLEGALNRADKALYAAKHSGRNCVISA